MHTELIAPIVNFAVVLLILWLTCRKAVANLFVERSTSLAQAIRGAEAEAAEAGKTLAQWEARWSGSEQEAAQIQEDARKRMIGFQEETLAQAKKQADRILEEAKLVGQSEAAKGKDTLQREVVRRSILMAKEYLTANLSESQQHKLTEEFVELLGNGTTK